jgi:CheY-like chemotaxis protein
VLVVDDNQTNRDILLQQLQGWRMQVHCVDSGPQALQVMEQAGQQGQPFELAVLDMHMPGMDGLQLAHGIQARPALACTRLIMLSSELFNLINNLRLCFGFSSPGCNCARFARHPWIGHPVLGLE